MEFLSYLISGISLGSIYAIIALGYTMVYGIAKMLNFAHGDIIMVGAYTVLITITTLNFPPIVGVLAGVVMCVLLGVVIERVAYKPLRKASPLSVLITAIGVSYLLQNIALLMFGSTKRSFPPIITVPALKIGALTIKGESLVTLLVTMVIMIALTVFINKSKTGKAMRAVSENMEAAQLMGINTNTTISITFAIGSGLAALGAILYCAAYPQVQPYMGSMPGLKAFIAAVLGGIGVIPGAMLGGFVMGIAECLTKGFISSQFADAVVFGILIVVLLVKPAGILGKKSSEKV